MFVSSFNSTSSPVANHRRQTFVLPDLRLTGAGARVNWSGVGSLLTASFPQDRRTVIAEGKDHIQVDRTNMLWDLWGDGSSIAYIDVKCLGSFCNIDQRAVL